MQDDTKNDAFTIIANIANELRKTFTFGNYSARHTQRKIVVDEDDSNATQSNAISDNKSNEANTTQKMSSISVVIKTIIATYITLLAIRVIFTENPFNTSIKFEVSLFILVSMLCYIITYYAKHIYQFISGEMDNSDTADTFHDGITTKVYRRLLLRNAVLNETESLVRSSNAHRNITKEYLEYIELIKSNSASNKESSPSAQVTKNPQEDDAIDLNIIIKSSDKPTPSTGTQSICQDSQLKPTTRAYNLAVTDLFVEKALAYLNRKAKTYNRQGFLLFTLALIAITIATCFAFYSLQPHTPPAPTLSTESFPGERLTTSFIKSFTFYGLIITIAVYACRLGKSLFDQAERIKDKRHALRQGRLFVHLNGGKLTIEELDKAFNWNTSPENAFFHFNPEAQAPWGNMLKEMMITIRETAKSCMDLAKSIKKSDS